MINNITTQRIDDHIAVYHNSLYIGCYHESVTLVEVMDSIVEMIGEGM